MGACRAFVRRHAKHTARWQLRPPLSGGTCKQHPLLTALPAASVGVTLAVWQGLPSANGGLCGDSVVTVPGLCSLSRLQGALTARMQAVMSLPLQAHVCGETDARLCSNWGSPKCRPPSQSGAHHSARAQQSLQSRTVRPPRQMLPSRLRPFPAPRHLILPILVPLLQGSYSKCCSTAAVSVRSTCMDAAEHVRRLPVSKSTTVAMRQLVCIQGSKNPRSKSAMWCEPYPSCHVAQRRRSCW